MANQFALEKIGNLYSVPTENQEKAGREVVHDRVLDSIETTIFYNFKC